MFTNKVNDVDTYTMDIRDGLHETIQRIRDKELSRVKNQIARSVRHYFRERYERAMDEVLDEVLKIVE